MLRVCERGSDSNGGWYDQVWGICAYPCHSNFVPHLNSHIFNSPNFILIFSNMVRSSRMVQHLNTYFNTIVWKMNTQIMIWNTLEHPSNVQNRLQRPMCLLCLYQEHSERVRIYNTHTCSSEERIHTLKKSHKTKQNNTKKWTQVCDSDIHTYVIFPCCEHLCSDIEPPYWNSNISQQC